MKSRINKLLYKYFVDGQDYSQVWTKNGRYHRDRNLPAIISDNGDMWWYIDGFFIDDNFGVEEFY